MQKSFMANAQNIKPTAYVIDAKDQILGRVAAKAATLLRGKHRPTFTPHTDMGDMVIITNASLVRVTGKKMQNKEYQRYSGYPSGQKTITLDKLLKKSPETVMQLAVNRMIPSGPLGNKARARLKIYAHAEHPHQSQKPEEIKI